MERKFDKEFLFTTNTDMVKMVSKFRPRGKDTYVVKIFATTKSDIKKLQEYEHWHFECGFPGDMTNGSSNHLNHKYHATIKKIKDGIIVTLTRIKRKQHKILKEVKMPLGSNVILSMKMRISVKEGEDLANPKTNPDLVFITQYAFTKRSYYGDLRFTKGTLHLTLKDGNLYDSKGKLFTAINYDYFSKNMFNGILGGE